MSYQHSIFVLFTKNAIYGICYVLTCIMTFFCLLVMLVWFMDYYPLDNKVFIGKITSVMDFAAQSDMN